MKSSAWVLVKRKPSRTLEKLTEFSSLRDGWHYGNGGPISADTVALASGLWGELVASGFTLTDAFPGGGGEVQLTAYHRDHFLSLMIEPDGETTISYQIKGRDVDDPLETMDRKVATAALKKIAGGIWNTYVCSTQKTSTTSGDVLRRLPSNYRLATRAHPSFAADV